MDISRFAPSTTGPAHPGTLLAALLCWLDARSRGARLVLRLEDLDPERSRPAWCDALERDLAWIGLDFDTTVRQSDTGSGHEAALDRLAERGRLYPCSCSRRDVARSGRPAPDGGFAYPGTCRERRLPAGGWRACREPLRARLDPGRVVLADESGLDLSQDPALELGDPVVRRRDAAIAYHLAGVVDDVAQGVTRVVRGRDLAVTTATQVSLARLLDLSVPAYRHHLLLLERHDRKLAKLHGAVGADALRRVYEPEALCGVLAHAAGLQADDAPRTPRELLADFSWDRVRDTDRVVTWTERGLVLEP